jgi:agmatine deiminase
MDLLPLAAEWSPHRANWVGFPSDPSLWGGDLDSAQGEAAALARALADDGGERVRLFASGEAAAAAARALTAGSTVEVVSGRFGDIWLRDTGPLFRTGRAEGFRFNGWGGKYILDGDEAVAEQLAEHAGVRLVRHDFILEGGALDHDGEGTVLTTRQCLLNPNRNPDWTEAVAERALVQTIGARKVLWLGDGLANDHTDGHVDNLARFVAPGVVLCQEAFGDDDVNRAAYDACAADLAEVSDAAGRRLKVVRMPSPGRITDEAGEVVPASHMNFVIANKAVVMPHYGAASTEAAVQVLKGLFSDRKVIALPSQALLTGGGSFHCITQQEPA